MRCALVCALFVACSQPVVERAAGGSPQSSARPKTITVIGTNDLHGALERLPIFAGFVANVRAARAADGGGVVLVDAGDLFQGTLESNLAEGADVIHAYNQLGYSAATIGNHEFDYGPVGPAVTAQSTEQDPRGALKARIAEAAFPFVATNILDRWTGERIAWPNVHASVVIDVAGVKVGILGATTRRTPLSTMPANFAGLKMAPSTARVVAAEAAALRQRGVAVVVLVAHMGSSCTKLNAPDDTTSCNRNEEIFRLLRDVPAGSIDVAVAGHLHSAVAHRINGAAVIESYSSGRAFGRVDVHVADHRVVESEIHPPVVMCPLDGRRNPVPVAECHPRDYEGRKVVPRADIQRTVDAAIARADALRSEELGVVIPARLRKAYSTESLLGNWIADLMLAARPDAQIAMTNGGGLRADIPAGPLTYGHLFAAYPFDNLFAIVELEGRYIRQLVATNLESGRGILSWGGLTATARCQAGTLDVAVEVGGQPIDDARRYNVVTSDFLASGGDALLTRFKLRPEATVVTDVMIRDAIADRLRTASGRRAALRPDLYDRANKRLNYVGRRPVSCRRATPRAEVP